MKYRFLLMPGAWTGAKEHVARPLVNDYKGEVPWVALVKANEDGVDFVRRDEVSGPSEIAELAAKARAWHERRSIKWSVAEKTWGFFGLFSRPLLLSATGDYDGVDVLNAKAPRYGVAMKLAGAVVADDYAPEILFTTSAIQKAREILKSEVVLFALPKRGWMHASALNPFAVEELSRGNAEIYGRAGDLAVTPDLFQVYLKGGKRAITLTRAEGGMSLLLNAQDDDDAQLAVAW